ncbi:MAG: hypothetical protein QW638_08660 [Candidatus Bathyarchaeia archaeon]
MTLDRNILFNIILGAMIIITAPALAALGEARLDAYISLYTLEYFAALAILRPRRRFRDFIAIALFIAFSIIVALRVLEILLK